MKPVTRLVIVLGDQLDLRSAALDGFDPVKDAVWMAEVAEESTKVWTSKVRIALFFSAMRHFRDTLRDRGWRVVYHEIGSYRRFGDALGASVEELKPRELVMVHAGEWAVQRQIEESASNLQIPLDLRSDRHFLCSSEEFARHAQGRKQLRMEFFYREMRRKTGSLMEARQPAGGKWNFDMDNREPFPKKGPGPLRPPRRFLPDEITREVIATVEDRFPGHPGSLEEFDWPVTAEQAREALRDFIEHRLADFGRHQDAIRTPCGRGSRGFITPGSARR